MNMQSRFTCHGVRLKPNKCLIVFLASALLVMLFGWLLAGTNNDKPPVITHGHLVVDNSDTDINYTAYFWESGSITDLESPSKNNLYGPWLDIKHHFSVPHRFDEIKPYYTKSSQAFLNFDRKSVETYNRLLRNRIAEKGLPKSILVSVLMVIDWQGQDAQHRMVVYSFYHTGQIYKDVSRGVSVNGLTKTPDSWKQDITLESSPVADAVWSGKWKQFGALKDIEHMPQRPLPPLEQMRCAKEKQKANDMTKGI